MYIEQRNRKFIARHDIPRALKPAFGDRREFNQVLQAMTMADARSEASRLQLEDKWRKQIKRARAGLPPIEPQVANDLPVTSAAAFDYQGWRKWVKGSVGEAQRREREGHVIDAVEDHMGLASWQELEEPGNETEREQFGHLVALGLGEVVPFADGIDDYLKSLGVVGTSQELKGHHLRKVAEEFASTRDLTTEKLQAWLTATATEGRYSILTMRKYVSVVRDYLGWLAKGHKIRVPIEWEQLEVTGREKLDKLPYPAAIVVQLEAMARERGQKTLADFIHVSRYTGARAKEVLSLHGEDIDLEAGSINLRGTRKKKGGGVVMRVCPIHDDLRPRLTELIEDAGSGPLFPGAKRQLMSQSFNRLKNRLKGPDGKRLYDDGLHDMHSIRRTMIDLLRNIGAREEIVASFVGHKVRTITYGLYVGPPPLAVQAETMKLLSYPKEMAT